MTTTIPSEPLTPATAVPAGDTPPKGLPAAEAPPIPTPGDAAPADEKDPQAGGDPDTAPAGSEAAQWRVQLREVEAETQALETTFAARLDAARRNHLEQMLTMTEPPEGRAEAVTFHDVADMWTIFGATPAQFYDDAGAFQPEALSAFLADATAGERAYLTKTLARPSQGLADVASVAAAEAAMTPHGHRQRTSGSASPWADALHRN